MAKQKPEMTETEEDELRKNPINNFCCGVCKDAEVMPFQEFKNHLLTVHKLNPEQLAGRKQMVLHMDGAQWFSSQYEWTLESGLKFTQFVKCARSKSDYMRY